MKSKNSTEDEWSGGRMNELANEWSYFNKRNGRRRYMALRSFKISKMRAEKSETWFFFNFSCPSFKLKKSSTTEKGQI